MSHTVGLVGCAAGGLEHLRTHFIEPMQDDGWTVAVTLTPAAANWSRASGEFDKIESVTGLPIRFEARLPTETSPHPPVDVYAVAPATANTVAKLALGIADNQALTTVGEALGNRRPPVVIFPRINAAHAAHPAWAGHIAALRGSGAHLVYGDDVWPLVPPRSARGRPLPWSAIRAAVVDSTGLD